MKTGFVAAGIAALGLAGPFGPALAEGVLRNCSTLPQPPEAIAKALDGVLSASVDPASDDAKLGYLAPGAVLLVRTPEWSYFRSAGVADLETGAPLDCLSPYEIGSATKMMTGTVVMQLQEEGRLSLQDRLADHLPEIASRLPFGDRITLYQLATHTSGVFSYTDNAPDGTPGLMEGALADPEMLSVGRSPEALIEFVVAHGEPGFEPGAEGQWAYSNTGFVLLGMIIEKITGQPLAEVFRARIFAPAGMADTFLWNDVPRPEFGLPRAWFKTPFEFETTAWNLSQGWAAGGVISTATDMALFLEGLGTGALFTEPDTLPSMLEGVPTAFPMLTYGVGLARKPGDTIGHGGQTLGFESDAAYAPESGTTYVIWTNAANSVAVFGVPVIVGALAGLD